MDERASTRQIGARISTFPEGAFWNICSQRFNLYRHDEPQLPQLFVACPGVRPSGANFVTTLDTYNFWGRDLLSEQWSQSRTVANRNYLR